MRAPVKLDLGIGMWFEVDALALKLANRVSLSQFSPRVGDGNRRRKTSTKEGGVKMLCKMSGNKAGVLSAVTLAVGIATFSLAAEAGGGGGWYTEAQASKGQGYFNTFCAQCHRPDLSGAMGPTLKGNQFLEGYKTGEDLYRYSKDKMPVTNPGSVPDKYMLPIVAFILSENGLPGGTELTMDNLNRPLKP
jgi:S-disulfanyl-L-cysteine oxidoreductase SoxD